MISFLGILIGCALACMGLWMGWQSAQKSPIRAFFWPGLCLKVAAGWLLGGLYARYLGGGDSWVYFAEAERLRLLALSDGWAYLDLLFSPRYTVFESGAERSYYAIHWMSLWHLGSGGSYWLTSAYLSALSFSGLWVCADAMAHRTWMPARWGGVAFLGMPSVVFWSSGWGKEGIVWFFMGWMIALVLRLQDRRPVGFWAGLIAIFGLWMVWKIKYYYLAALLPALLTYACAQRLRLVWGWQLLFYVLLLGLATRLHWNLHPSHLLEAIFESHHQIAAHTSAHNRTLILPLHPSLDTFLIALPKALCASLLRPFPWEDGHVLKALSGAEVLGLLLWAACGLRKRASNKITAAVSRAILALVLYVLPLALILPLAAPNIGSLVRYRVSFWPFWVLLLLALGARCLPREKRPAPRSGR